jgi:hypothetical protein
MVGKAYATTNCNAYTSFLLYGKFAGTSCNAIVQNALPPNYLDAVSAPNNTWKFVTYQFDDDNNLLKLYIDGLLIASYAWNFPLVYDNTPLQIGGEYDEGIIRYYFDGKLDDIRLYNRVLSDSEVKALFEEGTNKTVVSIQPVLAPTVSLNQTASNTIMATVGNVGNNPTYQWQKNSSAVTNTTPILIDNTLAVDDVITCTVTVTQSCYSPISVMATLTILNDECADAVTLSSGVEKSGTTNGAAPTPSMNQAPDVWYKFTPSVTGTLKVEVDGLSGFNTEFKIYTGTCGSLTNARVYPYITVNGEVNNSDFFGSKDQTVINATSGTVYYIRVAHASGNNISGNFKITATEYSLPTNNACSNATTLIDQVTANGTTVGARDLGSLSNQCAQPIVRNVWYKYTPTRNCALRVQVTPSSGTGIHLSAFTNACSSPASINFLPANSDCVSSLSFIGTVGTFSNIDQSIVATAGTTYYFSVKSAYNNLFGFYDGTFDIKVTESNVATIQLKSGAPSTICSGGSTTLQVDIRNLTAVTDYTLVYSDGTSNFPVNNYVPLTDIVVSPGVNRTYSLVSVTLTGGSTAISNLSGSVPINVNTPVAPSVSIAANPSNIICPGTNVTFTATALNTGGGSISYDFKKGSTTMQSGGPNTYSSNALANNDIITCEITITSGTCLSSNTAISNSITMDVSVDCTPRLNAKVFIEGAYNAGTMNGGLRTNEKIPLSQPYSTLIFSGSDAYSGTETSTQAIFDNNAIVDWVLVELRNATTPSTIVARRAALLQSDGDIVDTDGTSPLAFTGVATGTYHIVVRHRLCLATRTATAVALLNGNPISLNFTNNTNALSGSMKNLGGSGVYALYSGDTDRDGDIDATDVANVKALNPSDKTVFTYGVNAYDMDFQSNIYAKDKFIVRGNLNINQQNLDQ